MAPPSLMPTMSMSVTPQGPSDRFVSAGPLLKAEREPPRQPSRIIISDESAPLSGGVQPQGHTGELNGEKAAPAETDARGMKIVSYEEIVQHRTEEDAWIVVDGKVYDVTNFLVTHPGGVELLLNHLQEDCSIDAGPLMRGMDEDGHSHSKAAFKILDQFLVGSVEASPGSVVTAVEATHVKKYRYDVDPTKPLVAQVGHLGVDYDEWVHEPIVCKDSPRFFENDLCEFFTRTKWWVIPMVYCPVSFAMVYSAVVHENVPINKMPLVFVEGVASWTFLEYVMHRFLFHMKTSSFWGNKLHYMLHGFHHKYPMDVARLVFPPAFSAPICVLIWILAGSWIAPYPTKLVLYAGALVGYVAYDLIHYYLHFGTAFNDECRRMKTYHLNHHFKDHTNGYGITTIFWDVAFRTRLVFKDRRREGATETAD